MRAYVPHRLREGYGLNAGAIQALALDGVTLLVTSDCGTTAHREIALANQLGIDVIVTDHHQTDGQMPPALAVMNPYRPDGRYPFRGLCSGGLAFKVASAYQAKYGAGAVPLDSLLDLVALATVADVVPLQDENRAFVREGMARLSYGTRCGIRALKRVAGVTKACTTGTIAYKLAPRLNAAGRMDEAIDGVRLLTTDSEAEAERLAEHLERLNRDRQQLEAEIMEQALAQLSACQVPSAIVLASRRWHLGVVGVVAARLVERFHRPAVVVAINEEGIGKGSARTVPGFDLNQALVACRDLLVAFGGHPSAAGLTVREDRLPEFTERFRAMTDAWSLATQHVPTLHLDSEVTLDEVTPRLIQEIDTLHPFGAGNPEPMFAVKQLKIMSARVVGERHLKMTLRQGRSLPFDGIGFGMKSLEALGLSLGSYVDVACTPELNDWNGLARIQLRIRDIRPASDW
jgi:single-stranded-DNA-specific exonuclease